MYIESEFLSEKVPFDWDMGTEFASQLLSDINMASKRKPPFRIDAVDYKIYWAGEILRIDIPKASVT